MTKILYYLTYMINAPIFSFFLPILLNVNAFIHYSSRLHKWVFINILLIYAHIIIMFRKNKDKNLKYVCTQAKTYGFSPH